MRPQQFSQPEGDLRYSGATHNCFKVCFAMEGCVVQSISGLCSVLEINMKLMNYDFRSALVLATVPDSKDIRLFIRMLLIRIAASINWI